MVQLRGVMAKKLGESIPKGKAVVDKDIKMHNLNIELNTKDL